MIGVLAVIPGQHFRLDQVAKIALARKLPTVVWALLREGACSEESAFAERG